MLHRKIIINHQSLPNQQTYFSFVTSQNMTFGPFFSKAQMRTVVFQGLWQITNHA